MEFEDIEKKFQGLILSYGTWIQEMEEGWEMDYANFAFRRRCKNLITSCQKRIVAVREDLKELREKRWEVWLLEHDLKKKKIYQLMVSEDCGISYFQKAESNDLDALLKEGEKLNEAGLRWTIDKNGDPVEYCGIHKNILSYFGKE